MYARPLTIVLSIVLVITGVVGLGSTSAEAPLAASNTYLVEPIDGAIYSTDSVTIRLVGPGGLSLVVTHTYKVYLEGVLYAEGSRTGVVSTNYEIVLTDLPDGNYEVTDRVTGLLFTTVTESARFIVDTTDPQVSIQYPQPGTWLGTSDVTFRWTPADGLSGIDRSEVRLDGGSWQNVGAATSATLLELADSEHLFEVRTYDRAGNSRTAQVQFGVDTTAPSLSIAAPHEGEIRADDAATVQWAVSDDCSGLSALEVREWRNGIAGDWKAIESTADSYVMEGLSDGLTGLDVRATDNAGNVALDAVRWQTDIIGPQLEILSPQEGAATGSAAVAWQGTDPGGSIVKYYFCMDGEAWVETTLTSHIFVLDEGPHELTVKAVGASGAVVQRWVNFTYDISAPEVGIIQPHDGAVNTTGDIRSRWGAYDAVSGVEQLQWWLYRNGELVAEGDDAGDHVDLSGLAEGSYTFRVRAADRAGNAAEDEVSFKVDLYAPWVELTSPSGGIYSSGLTTVAWTGGDNVTTVHYTFRVDGGEEQAVTSPFTIALAEGEHVLTVTAHDQSGRSASASIQITIDLSSPDLSIDSPAAGAPLNRSDVTVQWSCEDDHSSLVSAQYRLNGGGWEAINLSGSFPLLLGDGIWSLELEVYDDAGNRASRTLLIEVDTVLPTLAIVSPEPGLPLSQDSVNVKWEGVDEGSGIVQYQYCLDGGEWQDAGMALSHEFLLDEGPHTVEVRAWDEAGNVRITSVAFMVDRTPPQLDISHPAGAALINVSEVTVQWSCQDTLSALATLRYRLNGGPWTTLASVESIPLVLEDGVWTLEVQAIDGAGNAATVTRLIEVDTTLPTLAILAPEAGAHVRDVNLRWEGSDPGSGLTMFQYRVDGGEWSDAGLATTTVLTLPDGTHTVEVRAWDEAGNVRTASVQFTADRSPPELTIISPADGAAVNGSDVTVAWSCEDACSDLALVRYCLNDGPWTLLTSLDDLVMVLEDGAWSIKIQAIDGAGNSAVVTHLVEVDTTSPTLAITSPLSGLPLSSATVNVKWGGADSGTGLSGYQYRLDGGIWHDAGLAVSQELTLTDGPHSVDVRACDRAGNVRTASVTFVIDTAPPELTITSPASAALLNASQVTVEWSCEDAHSGVASVRYRLNEGPWTAVASAEPLVLVLEDGTWNVELQAADEVGRTATASVAFQVDATAPTVVEHAPVGANVHPNASLSVSFSEAMSWATIEVDGVEGDLSWNGAVLTFDPEGPLEAGRTYLAAVTGEDMAGNGLFHSWSFTVTTNATIIGWVLDLDGMPVENATVVLDGGAAETTTNASGGFSFEVPAGRHTVTVVVPGHDPVTSTVDLGPGETTGPNPPSYQVIILPASALDLTPFIVLLLMVAIMVIAYVIATRRRPEENEKDREGGETLSKK